MGPLSPVSSGCLKNRGGTTSVRRTLIRTVSKATLGETVLRDGGGAHMGFSERVETTLKLNGAEVRRWVVMKKITEQDRLLTVAAR